MMTPESTTLEQLRRTRQPRPRERMGRLVLAEDDAEMRHLLASALREDQYEVVEVADGRDLLDRLDAFIRRGDPVDLVITDVRMPRISGLQALRFLKQAGFRAPVILITAFGDHGTHVDACLLGAEAVLDKPFELDELRTAIRKIRSRRSVEDQ